MPEFHLNATAARVKHPHLFYALDDFAKGYIEAMFFTNGDTGDERENLLNEMGVERLTKSAVESIAEDCRLFKIAAADLLAAAYLRDYDESQAGRDFWFTRQGHGVGFWDRKVLDDGELGDKLSDCARVGEAECWTANGWIHHS